LFRKIEKDKWKHFFVAIPLGTVLQLISAYIFPDMITAVIAALAVLAAICYGFELFSKLTGLGHYEMKDAIAGLLGGIIGMIPVVLLWN
jgi:VanZ family protein